MKIWITGIAGFLGSHLADTLIAQGHEVTGNDNLVCGAAKNVSKKIGFSYTDCRSFEPLVGFMKMFQPDVVVHCAAIASEGFSVFSPNFVTRNIAEASVSTFTAAIASGAKRIVHMTSMARYGMGSPPFHEDDELNPVDCYGAAKVYSEQQLKILCNTHGVKWTILSPHNIIGTRQQITPYRNVCTIFLNRLKLGLPIYIYGDGEQKRCFSPIADVLPSIVRAVSGDADSEVVNIGPDKDEITINSLLRICEDVTGKKSEVINLADRPLTDSVKEAYCNSDKSRQLLGYTRIQSLRDCIKEMSDALKPRAFDYNFPVEIPSSIMPRTWAEKL